MNKKERIFLDAMKHADRRYFTELSGRLRNPKAFTAAQKGRAFDMEKHEKNRKITKIAVGTLIAAAVLTGGTVAMSVAMHGSLGGYNQYSGTDSLISSSESKTDALGLNLTDTEWCDINATPTTEWSGYGGWFVPTERGQIHEIDFSLQADGTSGKTEEGVIRKFREKYPYPSSTIWYYSEEDAADVPLCARANCLHDGNEYCEASSSKYFRGNTVYYDGVLYAPARSTDGDHPKEQRICLLSYDLNGTGITELATFEKGDADPLGIVIHRGYVFCMFRVYEGGEMTADDPTLSSYHPYQGSGYVIWGYEIATGKTTELLRVMPKENNSKGFEKVPDCLTAGGDYVYFSSSAVWPATYTTGFYGINLLTGEVKSVLSTSASVGRQYLVYREEYQRGTYAVHVYNTETGEDTDCGKQPDGITVTDGKYICVVQRKESGTGSENSTYFIVHVYDMQMHELGSVESPPHYHPGSNYVMMQGGRIYIPSSGTVPELTEQRDDQFITHWTDPDTKVRSWGIDEIISGTATPESWQTHCTLVKEITEEMLYSE